MDEFIWVEKYRPATLDACVLPKKIKDTFKAFVKDKNIPNLILSGSPGVGKTSAAIAMMKEIDADYLMINGSMSGNIDTLRYEIKNFAQSMSLFHEGRKYVILDEADYLNANSTQPALRNFMEEYSRNCGFILTCNHKNRIIEELRSRCALIDFNPVKAEIPALQAQLFTRVEHIMGIEGITFDKAVMAKFLVNHYPDMRRVLNELQSFTASDKNITSALLANEMDGNFTTLVGMLKNRKFSDMRKWVSENSSVDIQTIIRKIYDRLDKAMIDNDKPVFIITAAKYQYQSTFSVDQEINTVAFLTEIMANVSFL